MLYFESPSVSMTMDSNGQITDIRVSGGENLIREPKPFAELAFFELAPAFTNEWIRPTCMKEPEYGVFSNIEGNNNSFVMYYTYGADEITLEFSVESVPEALIITLKDVCSTGIRPARISFARVTLVTDSNTVVTGMALDPLTEGESLPGLEVLQAARAYDVCGYAGRRWAFTGALRTDLRRRMQEITKLYTKDIPYMNTGGAFAKEARNVQGSYAMVYGSFLPGSLCPENLEEWIEMLHAIGLTQVDIHGAEDNNFSFGDFKPNPALYPEGRKSLKAMIDRLKEEGISSIMHTYSAQISPKSGFVTPIPDRNLGYNRLFTLTSDISAVDTEIPIAEDVKEISLVHTSRYNSSTYVVWDDEIIQFTELGEHSLKGCVRGALGTIPASHAIGAKGRNLKRMYNIFLPDIGGPLYDKVVKETANCANECGFDAFYFDALEAVSRLEGYHLMDYWCTRFVYDVARSVGRPIGMEMSCMNHNLWYTRSRMGAWDRSNRAHKQFLNRHAEVNSRAQELNLMPQNLGWWHLGKNRPTNASEWERVTTDVYETMGRLGAAYDFSLSFQGLSLITWKASEELKRIGDRIRRWEQLRLSGTLTEAESASIAHQECRMCPDGIYAAAYPEAVASFYNGEAEVCIENPYEEQQAMLLRLEPLHSRAEQAAEEKEFSDIGDLVNPGDGKFASDVEASTQEVYPLSGAQASDLLTFTSRTVTAAIADEESPYGPAICLTAQAQKDIGVARFERRFTEHLNIAGQNGCGVWIYGDGKGEILNFQLRSPLVYSRGLDERIVVVDFVGWRYFELIESSVDKTFQYLWPYYYRHLNQNDEFTPIGYEESGSDWRDSMYLNNTWIHGNPSHLTAYTPIYTHIAYAAVWINNMPKGEQCQVKIAGWHRFFTKPNTMTDIVVTGEHEDDSIRVDGSLSTDCIVEYSDGAGTPGLGEKITETSVKPSWYSSDVDSVPIKDCDASGMLTLKPGSNRLKIRANAPDGARLRVVCGVQDSKPLITR